MDCAGRNSLHTEYSDVVVYQLYFSPVTGESKHDWGAKSKNTSEEDECSYSRRVPLTMTDATVDRWFR